MQVVFACDLFKAPSAILCQSADRLYNTATIFDLLENCAHRLISDLY